MPNHPVRSVRPLKPCASCRSWDDCRGHWYVDQGEYYYLHEIRYCRAQVRWLIENFLVCDGDHIVLERQTWPSDIYVSGYTEAERTSHSISANHPGLTVQLVVGELAARLEATGEDGRLLVNHIRNGWNLGQGAKDALSYCLGDKRKRRPFAEWLAQRDYKNRQRLEKVTRL